MWVTTTRGFFSVVAHHDLPDMVLVRARVREDLEALGELVGSLEIEHTPQRDYALRAVVPRERWLAGLALLAAEIDYPNFKSAVAERQGHGRAAVYARVWFALTELQRE